MSNMDVDAGEIGGLLSWAAPADASQVTHYQAYLSFGSGGKDKLLQGGPAAVGNKKLLLPNDVKLGSFERPHGQRRRGRGDGGLRGDQRLHATRGP